MTQRMWNVRDQPKKELENLLTQKYKEIESNYKMLKKMSNIEDAERQLRKIWQIKNFVNTIEVELMRREYNNGTTS